jgi:murein DD-endopeptidase MepM/ murein hydrolase activator NlpD
MVITRWAGHSTLAGRVVLVSMVWLATVSLVLTVTTRGAAADAASGTAPVWQWPMAPLSRVERLFEPPASRYGPGHRGIDLAADPGQQVLAVAPGVVTHSGMVAGRGTVTVRHDGGLASTYEPVGERLPTGTSVHAGDPLGVLEGESHCPASPCLHLGARLGEEYLDPLLLLVRVRIVLLPLLPPSPAGKAGGF